MQDLPPKTVKTELVRLDDNLKKIERSQFAGIQRAPGSLPVLEAFQRFLEEERRMARRRLLVVTCTALLLIGASLLGGGLYLRHALQQTGAQTAALRNRTSELAQSVTSIHAQQTASEHQIERTKRVITAQHRRLLAQEKQVTRTQGRTQADLASNQQTIQQLREQMEHLLAEQNELRTSLATARFSQSGNRRAAQAQTAPGIGPTRKRQEQEPGAPAANKPFSIVTIQPEGRQTGGIRWMLPTGPAAE